MKLSPSADRVYRSHELSVDELRQKIELLFGEIPRIAIEDRVHHAGGGNADVAEILDQPDRIRVRSATKGEAKPLDDAAGAIAVFFHPALNEIAGRVVIDIWDQHAEGISSDFSVSELFIGSAISFGVGILALRWLIRWSRQDRLHWFAWWCFPVGILAILHFGLSAPPA